MTVDRRNTDLGGSGAAGAAANQSPITGPNRSDRALACVPLTGRPELPASRGAGRLSRRVDLGEPIPVWLAALIAASCQAAVNGIQRAIEWYCVSGRAIYTNCGVETEIIQPLGIPLKRGDTLAVYWVPGETEYTFEVVRHADYCA
jgi:hypothetical protein